MNENICWFFEEEEDIAYSGRHKLKVGYAEVYKKF
jgi:hypothetical protein